MYDRPDHETGNPAEQCSCAYNGEGRAALPEQHQKPEQHEKEEEPAIYRGVARPTEPPIPGDPAGIPELTPRERQVLALVGQAAQNRQISQRLGIAERTVKAHLANLMAKIDVATRIEAAIFAYAHHQDIQIPEDSQTPC